MPWKVTSWAKPRSFMEEAHEDGRAAPSLQREAEDRRRDCVLPTMPCLAWLSISPCIHDADILFGLGNSAQSPRLGGARFHRSSDAIRAACARRTGDGA